MRKSIVSIAAAVVIWPVVAAAAPPQLKGTYAFTGMGSCLYSGGPFTDINPNSGNPDGSWHPTVWPNWSNGSFPPPGMASGNGIFSSNFSVEGMRTFNGDGTGSVAGTSVEIVGPPALTPRASVENFTASFTYQADPNGGFDIQLTPGTYLVSTSVPVDGTAAQTVWTDNLSLYGLASNNNQALTLASTTANIETQTSKGFFFVSPKVTGTTDGITTRYRICARSRSLIWQGN